MRYNERLQRRIEQTGSRLCVGLDPRPTLSDGVEEIPEFLKRLVGETWEYTAAFKPNMAYFEAMGIRGLEILEEMLGEMPKEVPVILDAKRSDIGETQKYYAKSYFENWAVDAVTLNPFLGYDSLEPFLDWEGKGIYILAVTSNPGSADFQRLKVGEKFMYELVQELAERAAQGGDLENLSGKSRTAPDTINVSRGISYKEMEKSFSQKAKEWADKIAAAYPV